MKKRAIVLLLTIGITSLIGTTVWGIGPDCRCGYGSYIPELDFNWEQKGNWVQFQVCCPDKFTNFWWKFKERGDWEHSSPEESHLYHHSGNYIVTLQAQDVCGRWRTVSKEIKVDIPTRNVTQAQISMVVYLDDLPPAWQGIIATTTIIGVSVATIIALLSS